MIWTLFVGLLSSLWARFSFYIVMIGSALLALLAFTAKQRSVGREQMREKHRKANEKAANRTAQIVKKVQRAGDDEIHKRLDKYYRD